MPASIERGFADHSWGGWHSALAPKGTPAPVPECRRRADRGLLSAQTIDFITGHGLAPATMGEVPPGKSIIRETPLHRDLTCRAGLEPN
ncbi:hypothetical protein [Roseomonas sp. HF4]|uniref:hypothetical protein n=1 Tax=Roseomonas sp. HF4 TaxID=2562313 RepID=UPI0010BFE695|nr:hypothetical protein [Roseomonas sp. HF4]